jgi:hypothetical protein
MADKVNNPTAYRNATYRRQAIRTAPLSKRISKEIFRPSHQELSPLY